MSLLTQLMAELNAGTLKVVDLTQPLGPETPVIGLPRCSPRHRECRSR